MGGFEAAGGNDARDLCLFRGDALEPAAAGQLPDGKDAVHSADGTLAAPIFR
jgi:hypothetical protein